MALAKTVKTLALMLVQGERKVKKKCPATAVTVPGANPMNNDKQGLTTMVAVGDVIGKFGSLKYAEKALERLGFTKTRAGWMGERCGAQITYLPATKRYQASKVVPA